MKPGRSLAAAGVAAAAVAVGRRRRRPRLFRLFVRLALLNWGDDLFDQLFGGLPFPVSVIAGPLHTALHFIAQISDDVTSYVQTLYNAAVAFTHNLVGAVYNTLIQIIAGAYNLISKTAGELIADFEGLYNAAIAFATGIYNWAVTQFDNFVAELKRFAGDAANAVLHAAQDLYNAAVKIAGEVGDAVLNDAKALYNAAVQFATDLFNGIKVVIQLVHDFALQVANDIGNSVLHAAQDLFNRAEALSKALVDELYNHVILPALADILPVVQWVIDHAIPVIGFVEHALEWLIWVDTKVITEAIATYKGIRDADPSTWLSAGAWGRRLQADNAGAWYGNLRQAS